MKLEYTQQQLEGRLEPGERVLVSSTGVPLVNTKSLTSADLTGGSHGGLGQSVGQAIGGGIVRRHDKMIQRNAVVGEEGTIAQTVPTEATAFALVLTDRRLALYRLKLDQLKDVAWEISRDRITGIRKLARTTVMRRMRVHFDDGSAVELSVPPGKALGILREELGVVAG